MCFYQNEEGNFSESFFSDSSNQGIGFLFKEHQLLQKESVFPSSARHGRFEKKLEHSSDWLPSDHQPIRVALQMWPGVSVSRKLEQKNDLSLSTKLG